MTQHPNPTPESAGVISFNRTNGSAVLFGKGGVTGYEGWYVDHLLDFGLFDDPDDAPIYANAGGMGWAELKIDGAGFRAIVRLFLSRREDFKVTR